MEGSPRGGRSAVRSGLVTGISTAAVSGAAAVAAVILSRKFGHGVKTDGFFIAYGVYLAVVLVTGAVRVVALPRFVRAHAGGRLGAEVGTWVTTLAGPLALVVVVVLIWPHGVAGVFTAEPRASRYAADLLPWLVPSAAAQVVGGVVASALAALDDYGTAAFGFGFGSVAGIALTVALIGHGVIAFGWGIALNGALSLGIPLAVLIWKRGISKPDHPPWTRLVELVDGVTLPVALQGLFLIGNRFASAIEPGDVSTFSYAFLIASFLVSLTAASLALVSTAPFARERESAERTTRHVVAVSWLSLAPIAAAAGICLLAGADVFSRVLGVKYGGATGAELSRLVVYLAPWMVASVAFTVAYPLLFVRGRARWLPALAFAALLVHVPVEWGGRAAFGLGGIAGGMAVTTGVVVVTLLWQLEVLRPTLQGIVVAAAVCGGLAAVAFAVPSLLLGAIATAVVGAVLYSAALLAWRPAGLRAAWTYVRTLQ